VFEFLQPPLKSAGLPPIPSFIFSSQKVNTSQGCFFNWFWDRANKLQKGMQRGRYLVDAQCSYFSRPRRRNLDIHIMTSIHNLAISKIFTVSTPFSKGYYPRTRAPTSRGNNAFSFFLSTQHVIFLPMVCLSPTSRRLQAAATLRSPPPT